MRRSRASLAARIVALIGRLAEQHGVRVEYVARTAPPQSWGGYYLRPDRIVLVQDGARPRVMLCNFMHELSHHHCHENALWRAYHDHDDEASAYRAERWVARHAQARYISLGFHKRYGAYYDPYLHDRQEEVKRWLKDVPDI